MLLLLSDTEVAAAAAWVNATVHVLDALLPKVEGLQDTEVNCCAAAAARLRAMVRVTPPALAVIVPL